MSHWWTSNTALFLGSVWISREVSFEFQIFKKKSGCRDNHFAFKLASSINQIVCSKKDTSITMTDTEAAFLHQDLSLNCLNMQKELGPDCVQQLWLNAAPDCQIAWEVCAQKVIDSTRTPSDHGRPSHRAMVEYKGRELARKLWSDRQMGYHGGLIYHGCDHTQINICL